MCAYGEHETHDEEEKPFFEFALRLEVQSMPGWQTCGWMDAGIDECGEKYCGEIEAQVAFE